jgi:hypothetical protein
MTFSSPKPAGPLQSPDPWAQTIIRQFGPGPPPGFDVVLLNVPKSLAGSDLSST